MKLACLLLSEIAQYRQQIRDRWPCLLGRHLPDDRRCVPPACLNCGRTL